MMEEKKVLEATPSTWTEPEFLELTSSELIAVKKEIYDQAFKKFEEEYEGQASSMSQFFEIENDSSKDKS